MDFAIQIQTAIEHLIENEVKPEDCRFKFVNDQLQVDVDLDKCSDQTNAALGEMVSPYTLNAGPIPAGYWTHEMEATFKLEDMQYRLVVAHAFKRCFIPAS
jgi:hypothetical protein